jgi:hypothetical protein
VAEGTDTCRAPKSPLGSSVATLSAEGFRVPPEAHNQGPWWPLRVAFVISGNAERVRIPMIV